VIAVVVLLALVFAAAGVALEGWLAMLVEGALANSMDYVIPTLSFESSIWLVLLFSILGGAGAAAAKVGKD
jgi:hypothetical protein